MEYKDYYKTLGVGKSASETEIKDAYRKLARKYHPDVNKDPKAEDMFKEINEAYQVLSDAEKRKKYDQFGSQWQQYQNSGGNPADFNWGPWRQQPGQGGAQYRTVTPEEFSEIFGGMGGGGGFSDFFETLFGGLGGGAYSGGFTGADTRQSTARGQRTARPAARDMEHETEISLAEAFSGTKRTLQFDSGKTLEASIPPGVDTGSRVRLRGQAGGADLYLRIKVAPDARFTRNGANLSTRVPVDFFVAALGGEVEVPAIDKTVKLTIPAGTDTGKTFRLKGLGMPHLRKPAERGDLLATVELRMPKQLSPAELEKLRELKEARAA